MSTSMLNISCGLPGGIGASAAAGGAAAVTEFPAGSGQVPVENGHQEDHDADPGQDQRNMPEADVIHAAAEDDARDGRRGDRADIAEGPQGGDRPSSMKAAAASSGLRMSVRRETTLAV